MARTKLDRIVKYICNYIIDNKFCLDDDEEENYGQCVASFRLTDALQGTNISVGKLTVNELYALCEKFTDKVIYRDDDEKKEDYGELHHISINFAYPIEIEIWDGF